MTTETPTRSTDSRHDQPLTHPVLPRWAPALVGVIALATSSLLALLMG